MIDRSFLEKIEQMAEVEGLEFGGVDYTSKEVFKIKPPLASHLNVTSLTSVVDYLKANVDCLPLDELIIRVDNFKSVTIFSKLDDVHRVRELYINAIAEPPDFKFDYFHDRESFNIMLQARFVDAADRSDVLRSIGKMRYENEVKMEDDGITQTVASKAGVALVREDQIPNPVRLAPFRTFSEIEQPISPFILRVDDKCNVGLFEADGGAWKNKAMQSIKNYLEFELGDGYTIIA